MAITLKKTKKAAKPAPKAEAKKEPEKKETRGRPPINGKPMTKAEYQARWRARKKAGLI